MPPVVHVPDEKRLFSDILFQLCDSDRPNLSLRELVEAFGERGFGALILILSLLALLPWPPGAKAIFSMPIILLSLELMFQRHAIWLPKWALRGSLSRNAYRAGVTRIIGTVRKVENLSKPRLAFLTGEVADIFTGLICVLLAVMMALPVPFGDALPAFALVLFSLGMMQRDGLAILLGVIMSVVCGLYLMLVWTTVVEIISRVIGWLSLLFT